VDVALCCALLSPPHPCLASSLRRVHVGARVVQRCDELTDVHTGGSKAHASVLAALEAAWQAAEKVGDTALPTCSRGIFLGLSTDTSVGERVLTCAYIHTC